MPCHSGYGLGLKIEKFKMKLPSLMAECRAINDGMCSRESILGVIDEAHYA